MKRYRDLGPDEVLQEGDEWFDDYWKSWSLIPGRWCGLKNLDRPLYAKRRPLTPAEIVAEERKRFEAWFVDECGDHEWFGKNPRGVYENDVVMLHWRGWCDALGIEPDWDAK